MMRDATGDAHGAASTFSISVEPTGGDDGGDGLRDVHLVPAGAPQAQQACGVLTWEGLTVTVRDAKGRERQILKRADGILQPGELLAVMGARASCLVCGRAIRTHIAEARCLHVRAHASRRPVGLRQKVTSARRVLQEKRPPHR
jgi:bacterioferritin-associated ferredoxin